MSDFLSGFILLLAFGYGLFALGWILVAWTEYKFFKEYVRRKNLDVNIFPDHFLNWLNTPQ